MDLYSVYHLTGWRMCEAPSSCANPLDHLGISDLIWELADDATVMVQDSYSHSRRCTYVIPASATPQRTTNPFPGRVKYRNCTFYSLRRCMQRNSFICKCVFTHKKSTWDFPVLLSRYLVYKKKPWCIVKPLFLMVVCGYNVLKTPLNIQIRF